MVVNCLWNTDFCFHGKTDNCFAVYALSLEAVLLMSFSKAAAQQMKSFVCNIVDWYKSFVAIR